VERRIKGLPGRVEPLQAARLEFLPKLLVDEGEYLAQVLG
jgi:hypothetical protein